MPKFEINLSGDPSLLDVLISLEDAGFIPVVFKGTDELTIVSVSDKSEMTPALSRAITRRETDLVERLRRFTPPEFFAELALVAGKAVLKKLKAEIFNEGEGSDDGEGD